MGLSGVSRRELLAGFLGLPAAIAACRGRPRPPLPPGTIVGASDLVGHRLREPPPPIPAGAPRTSVGIAIVGAGVAGLAAAWRLAGEGRREAPRAAAAPPSPRPWGAHYIAAPFADNRALVRLLGELDATQGLDAHGDPVIREELLCRDPQERVFYKGRWTEGLYLHAGATADDLRQLRAFEDEVARLVAFRDARGRRAFTLPASRCTADAEILDLDRITMADWMDARGFTSWRLRWFVEHACRDDYGATLAQTSAWAGLFYFAARVRTPGAESQPFITWPERNRRLVAHLAAAAGPRLETGWSVVDVSTAPGPDPAGRSGCTLLAFDHDRAPRVIAADHVIFAAPRFVAARVIRAWRERPPAHLASFRHGAWMVANLHLSARPSSRGFPMAWDNVLVESPSLGYITATHQLGIDRGPTVLTYYLPLVDDDPAEARRRLLAATQPEWADVILADLERAHPDIRSVVTRIDVMRWGHAMVRPSPGLRSILPAAAAPLDGIHFACTDLSGVPLFEEALDQGVRAAEEVLRPAASWR
jgi:hypothetical protein